MATVVKNPRTSPEITFNKLHIDTVRFNQIRPKHEGDFPVRSMLIQGTTYATQPDGDMVYDPKTFGCKINNVDSVIINEYCTLWGKSLSEVPADLAAARSRVISDLKTGKITDLDLMAAFEVALGRVLELSGTIEVESVE